MKDPANKPPDTTAEQDTVTAGQRRINLIWEVTQAIVALAVTGAKIYASLQKIDAPALDNSFFLIIGFYFSRTNHSAIGGVGQNPTQKQDYVGR